MRGSLRKGRFETAAWVAASVMVVGLVGGCSGESTPKEPGTSATTVNAPTGASTPTVDSSVEAEVLDVYAKLRNELTKIYADPKRSLDRVGRYAKGKARSNMHETARFYRDRRIVLKGSPTHSPTVEGITDEGRVVEISDCVDESDVKAVDAKTGKDVTGEGQLQRYKLSATAEKINGTWFIVKSTPHRDRPC